MGFPIPKTPQNPSLSQFQKKFLRIYIFWKKSTDSGIFKSRSKRSNFWHFWRFSPIIKIKTKSIRSGWFSPEYLIANFNFHSQCAIGKSFIQQPQWRTHELNFGPWGGSYDHRINDKKRNRPGTRKFWPKFWFGYHPTWTRISPEFSWPIFITVLITVKKIK